MHVRGDSLAFVGARNLLLLAHVLNDNPFSSQATSRCSIRLCETSGNANVGPQPVDVAVDRVFAASILRAESGELRMPFAQPSAVFVVKD
jgi:hypothetical protein